MSQPFDRLSQSLPSRPQATQIWILIIGLLAGCSETIGPDPIGNAPVVSRHTQGLSGSAVYDSRAYVTNEGSNDVSVVDVETEVVVATVPVGLAPRGVAIAPDGQSVYVANSGSNTLSMIDTDTNTVSVTIPVGNVPQDIAITPDGTLAYVANVSSTVVSVVDLGTNSVVATTVVGPVPVATAITPDGTSAYVVSNASRSVSIVDVASATVIVPSVPVGLVPTDVAITPDGSSAYVTSAFPNDGVTVIDVATSASATSISFNAGNGIVITPDGFHAYVTGSSGAVLDLTSNSVSGVWPANGAHKVAITPDGTRVFATLPGFGAVRVVDTATNSAIGVISVGSEPWGVAISPSVESPEPEIVEVEIEVIPGRDPNCINPRSRGFLQVALLSGSKIDLFDVDVSMIHLHGVQPTRHWFNRDVNRDGLPDRVFQFRISSLVAVGALSSSGVLTLAGELLDGSPFAGSDAFRVTGWGCSQE